jgi:purine-binding chemotaxis protein CheW
MRNYARVQAAREAGLVVFVVGGVRYAVRIEKVREIVAPLELTQLPDMPFGVAGVCDHRDEVVVVVDLRALFGLPRVDRPAKNKWVIADTGGRAVGLIADDVVGVVHVESGSFRGAPELGGARARVITSVASHDEQLLFVMDTSHFQSFAERAPIPPLGESP